MVLKQYDSCLISNCKILPDEYLFQEKIIVNWIQNFSWFSYLSVFHAKWLIDY